MTEALNEPPTEVAVTDRGQWLTRLAGSVIAAAVFAVLTVAFAGRGQLTADNLARVAALTCLVAVANSAVVRVRVRSTVVGTSWTDGALLVVIVISPPAWVPACAAVGVLVAKLIGGVSPFKAAYNAAKDALSVTIGLLVGLWLGVAGVVAGVAPLDHLVALASVAASVALVEHLIGVPVLSLATGAHWRQVLFADFDFKITSMVGKFLVAILTLALIQFDTGLVAAVPPLALCLHLVYVSRVRTRAERAAWQRLAATTEELNSTDLPTVLTAAATNAANLFSADEAEIFVRGDGAAAAPALVRADAHGVSWSGDPGRAPLRRTDGESITARLIAEDGGVDLGEVRLHFRDRVRLSERERLTLRTFASALRTAVRNAIAFAEAEALAQRYAHAAVHDPLTGLANRRRLHEYADEVLGDRPAGVTALIVLDLNHFQEVNETLGHVVGDRLLTEVARRLERAVEPASLLAGLGGDEFAVLLVGLSEPGAAERAARELLATLDAPIDLGGTRVRVEACGGVAIAEPELDGGTVELLRRANVALYQAKHGSRRVVRFEPECDTADLSRLMLSGDLPRAVAEGEFAVMFQPIVDLASGDMIAAEALARWRHPERGYLDPRLFLTAIERSELRGAFAEAVLDQALAAQRRWRAAGVDGPVAVNASPRSLLDPTFPRMVKDRLAAHGVAPKDLVIELAESLTLNQLDLIEDVLRELREAGIRLALDDFGTGSSSLAMLAKVPVYELKIDRSFVVAMGSSTEAAAVVRSTVELCRSLDLLVVAEGVERAAQREALRELGCQAGQGHLFARPMPVDALLAAIAEGAGGAPGRLIGPAFPAPAGETTRNNVIELPRPRRNEPPPNGSPDLGTGSIG